MFKAFSSGCGAVGGIGCGLILLIAILAVFGSCMAAATPR